MGGTKRGTGTALRWLLTGGGALVVAAWVHGYDQYSTNQQDLCAACHGDFLAGPYTELAVGGQTWASDLMDVHNADMLGGDCNTCHIAGGRFPVPLDVSRGGVGLSHISCAGCHGRTADGTGVATEGTGAGLRQRHWNANRTLQTPAGPMSTRVCGDCHQRADLGGLTDADPANFATVGEQVQPPYYLEEPGTVHPNIPDDPCNQAGDEDIDGATVGLDNDGDGVHDMADTDCSGPLPTPGEASGPTLGQLLITAVNPATSTLTVSYGSPCLASGHSFVVGDLTSPFAFGYSGDTQCSIGATGTYDWSFAAVPGDVFFLVVANDAAFEGSYGLRAGGTERPQDLTCGLVQNLADRCD